MAETIYSLEQISSWQAEMKEFAKTPRTSFTKRQLVETMIDDIEAALEHHTYHEVADKLKGLGLEISQSSLKQYVNAYRREHKPEKKVSSRKPSRKQSKRPSDQATEQPTQLTKATAVVKDMEQSRTRSPSPVAVAAAKSVERFDVDNHLSVEPDIPRRKKSSSRFIEMPEDL